MTADAPHSEVLDSKLDAHIGAASPLAFMAAFALLVLAACSDAESRAPASDSSILGAGGDPVASAAPECSDGAVEPCSVMLGEHAGIISCYEGTRVCSGGAFGACQDGHTFELSARAIDELAASPRLRPLAFSTPSDCLNNPCNSYCREFNEVPELGLAPDLDTSAPPLSTWQSGALASYPPDSVLLANLDPCETGSDCQFNSECVDPSLGSCSHSVCAEGNPLLAGCGRCATTVCALDANCCGTQPVCSHDPCEVGFGEPLDPVCDTCVQAVCDSHPECCSITWDATCVGYVATECAPLGQSCGCPDGALEADGTCYVGGDRAVTFGEARDACSAFGFFSGTWALTEITSEGENAVAQQIVSNNGFASAWLGAIETGVDTWSWQSNAEVFFINDADGGALQNGYTYANWAPGAPELGNIGRGLAMSPSGSWRDEDQSQQLDYVCEGPPNRLGPKQGTLAWDAGCVALAKSECGVECPERLPLGIGACTERIATQLDEECASFDVAVGAPCEDAGTARVPVCNHGQSPAPAGLRLVHLPASELGRSAPDLSDLVECTLTTEIPPGRCINIDGCPGLGSGRALWVNPSDGSEDAAECLLDDNWALYEPAACAGPLCEAGVYDGGQVALNGCSIAVQNPLGIDPALAQLTLEGAVGVPHCNPGEVRWGNSCYLFPSNPETWSDAADRCRGRGDDWDLVALNSPAENAWIRSMTDSSLDLQIGLNDIAEEGVHVWSNGSCTSYLNWHVSQPNNSPPGSQQCVRMRSNEDTWADRACDDSLQPYVCEGPVIAGQGGCASGQLLGPDGACYLLDTTPLSWSEAQGLCAGMGTGWSLARIDDAATNEFVTAVASCNPAWLDNPPGALANFEAAVVVDASDTPFIDALGLWQLAADSDPRATLCRGPALGQPFTALAQVADAGSCSGAAEYYFAGSSFAPEALTLCPDACSLANAVPGNRLELEVACLPPPQPALETVFEDIYYNADCADGGPIWDFLYYDSVTPADSRVEFEIRTAPTVAELEAGGIPFVPVATAQAVPDDTQRCEVSPPNCPIDIFTLLGSPAYQQQVLELRVTLIPGSSGEGPLLRDWTVRYSCPPAQ